ncbi:MAG: NfeD family protein [Planctomycetaceae bacterium]|nr:NfeD family protein [Planctomycetaceae bacterium]
MHRLCSPLTAGRRVGWVAACLPALVLSCVANARAQEEAESAPAPIGQFLTISSPVDDRAVARISNTANDLLMRSRTERRPAVFVLQITPGTSQWHQVQALARMLTSSQFSGLRTVAWIPETVTGPNALVALACQDIVMHPDAELGDLGRGQPVEPEDVQLVLAIAQKRVNPKVTTALVQAMLDPQEQLWRVRLQAGDAANPRIETRSATRQEVETLRKSGAVIDQADVVKESGVLGTFRGSTARDLEILVSQTAETRPDVARLYNLPRESLRELPLRDSDPKVRRIRVTGVINTLQESFLVRQIERAQSAGAETIVFEIESPGGELLASINLSQAIADLDGQKIRTVAYIPKQALSGAAIIALGCDEIYMHDSATIGDAGPIELKAGGAFERAPEKILSPLRVALKTLAERKGRPVALCEAMADVSLKVFQATNRDNGRVWYMSEAEMAESGGEWIPGPQVREANGELLLTLDGRRAYELQIAERPVDDLEDVKVRLGLPATYHLPPVEKTWVDHLVFTLNHPAMVVLLFMVGIGSLYLELHFPSGFFGILSCVCFALFFWSKFLGGTAGWLEIVLFALGAGCLALEIFVLPGFGVFGLSGILLILASLVMASQSWGNLEPYRDLNQLTYTLGSFFGAIFAVGVLALTLGRYLPHVPMFEGLVLNPPGQLTVEDEPRLAPELLDAAPAAAENGWIGRRGSAASLLRPAGKAQINGRLIDVVSEGPFIPEGTPIEVVQVSGNRIVVRRLA